MALNIKNAEVERLAALTGATKIEQFYEYMEREVWPGLPPEARRPMTKEEEDEILGYGPHGYFEEMV